MTEHEFTLADRIAKIKSVNEQYDLESNAYLSFSGGKDSTVLHYLLDEALPGNKIPRLYLDTGIEYNSVRSFVKGLSEKDSRVVFLPPKKNIKKTLEEFGYPFKSKEHSLYLSVYQKSGMTKTVERYLTRDSTFACPKYLRYQFSKDFSLKVSNKCCKILKKDLAESWAKENGRSVTITGMRREEGGLRAEIKGCAVFLSGKLKKFHPLLVVSEGFEDWYLSEREIKLCELYYPPYNFKRTGCKGCPYNPDLKNDLLTMALFFPNERKQCEAIWKPVYEEYRKIGKLPKIRSLFE